MDLHVPDAARIPDEPSALLLRSRATPFKSGLRRGCHKTSHPLIYYKNETQKKGAAVLTHSHYTCHHRV